MNTATVARDAIPTIFRPEVDYRLFAIASGEAHQAIERLVLSDLWSAYERMHAAAAMGPMNWTGPVSPLAFAVSRNSATLAAGDLKVDMLSRVISGITRNVCADDRFRVWTETDHIMRGARRIHLFGLRRNVADISTEIAKRGHDLSSAGLQNVADLRSDLERTTRQLAGEMIVCGLVHDAVVA